MWIYSNYRKPGGFLSSMPALSLNPVSMSWQRSNKNPELYTETIKVLSSIHAAPLSYKNIYGLGFHILVLSCACVVGKTEFYRIYDTRCAMKTHKKRKKTSSSSHFLEVFSFSPNENMQKCLFVLFFYTRLSYHLYHRCQT